MYGCILDLSARSVLFVLSGPLSTPGTTETTPVTPDFCRVGVCRDVEKKWHDIEVRGFFLCDVTEKLSIKPSQQNNTVSLRKIPFVKLKSDPGVVSGAEESAHPSTSGAPSLPLHRFHVKLLSVFSTLPLFSCHRFKDPTTLASRAPSSHLHTYLHSKTSRSFPLNFQETSCFPSSVSRTALTLFPFKLQDKHTHTPTHIYSMQAHTHAWIHILCERTRSSHTDTLICLYYPIYLGVFLITQIWVH